MKKLHPGFLILVLVCPLVASSSLAQFNNRSLGSEREPVVVSISGAYEAVTSDGITVSESSFPLAVFAPLNRNVRMSLATGGALASMDGAADLGGIRDVAVNFQYSERLTGGSIALLLGLNIPSGKKELSLNELNTAVQLSQRHFAFRTPGFGQGFNIAPGVAWAFALNDDVVAGLTGKYAMTGAFRPIAGMVDNYEPGNELSLGAGLDLALSPSRSLSFDISFGLYSADKIGGVQIFEAGNKISLNTLFRQASRNDELRVLVRYQNRDRGSVIPSGNTQNALLVQTIPSSFEVSGWYRWRATSTLHISLSSAFQSFTSSTLYDSLQVVILSTAPTWQLSDNLQVLLQLGGTLGGFSGWEVSGGITYSL